ERGDNPRPSGSANTEAVFDGTELGPGQSRPPRVLVACPAREIGGAVAYHGAASPALGAPADNARRGPRRRRSVKSAAVERQRAVSRSQRGAIQHALPLDKRDPFLLPLDARRRDTDELGQPLRLVDQQEHRP